MGIRKYKILAKFPFNFSVFKRAKYVCGYLNEKVTCSDLISVCKDKDLKSLLNYLIERKDNRFLEVLANSPDFLLLPDYAELWKIVIQAYPEKILDILEKLYSTIEKEDKIFEELLEMIVKGTLDLDKVSLDYKYIKIENITLQIFKKLKCIWEYLNGKKECSELVKVCEGRDLDILVRNLIKHDDERFKEVLANRPDLLRLPEYKDYWKKVIIDYPEKMLNILKEIDFIEDAKIIKESLEKGLVGLDLEVSPDGESIEASGVVFLVNGTQADPFSYSNEDIDKFVKLLNVLSKTNTILVGHNILNHDLVYINKLYNIKLKNRIVDTLYLQCLVEPGLRPRALSMQNREHKDAHCPDKDAEKSIELLGRLVRKIKEYGLVEKAKELLSDNPYLSGLMQAIENFEDAPDESRKFKKDDKRRLFVVTDWKGLATPWSPRVLDPESYSPKNVWERAAIFSAFCALKDPICGFGDPNTFSKTWINDENTRKAILEVSKAVKERKQPETSVETLSEYVRYLTEKFDEDLTKKFDEVELYDGELILSTAPDLSSFFKLSSNVRARVSLAKAFSEMFKTIGLDSVTLIDAEYDPPTLLLPESSSLDPLNIASNIAGLLKHINKPAFVLVSNNYEKALAKRIFLNNNIPTYVADSNYDRSAFRKAIENGGVVIANSREGIPEGIPEDILKRFESLILFSDKSIIKISKGNHWREKLIFGFMGVYGLARKLNAEKIAYLSFSSGDLSNFLHIPEFGKLLKEGEKINIYKRVAPQGDVFINVWDSIEDAVSFAEKITEDIWGFRYKPYQRKAVAMLLSAYSLNRSTSPFGIIVLPTGAGKSVIFQSVAVALHKMTGAVTIVVSPLQALIQDQVESLKKREIKVAKLDSTVSPRERFKTVLDAIFGNIVLLYVTPERFEKDELKNILKCGNVGYVILDEVHCLSTWGSTFRPSYKYMARTIASEREKRFLPIYGFSATLPKDVLKDIINELNNNRDIKDSTNKLNSNLPREIHIDFNTDFVPEDVSKFESDLILRGPATRPEIKINIIKAKDDHDKYEKIIRIVKDLRDSLDRKGEPWIGLVFASFVKSHNIHKNVKYIADMLSEGLGEEVLCFHGQMSQVDKKEVIRRLERAAKSLSKPRIVVATKAFGMGVDLPNIRFVVHAHVSDSLEDYYQEIGRGGRDRRECHAITVYSPDDFDEKRKLIKRVDRRAVGKLLEIIDKFTKYSDEVGVPLNAFYDDFGLRDGRATLKRLLQVLEDNDVIEYEITNGNLKAYRILRDVNLDSIKNAILYHDTLRNVVVLDVNTPKMYISVLEERLREFEEEGTIECIDYSWEVDGKEIKISPRGYKTEIGYIKLKRRLKLEEISLLREWEYYQLQHKKLSQLEAFFEEIQQINSLEEKNRRAHELLRRYLEEGIAGEFEKKLAEKMNIIKSNVVDRLGDKAVIFGLMGSGKTDVLAKIASYYANKYSEKCVVIVVPDKGSSDILSRIRKYLGRDVNIDVKVAKTVAGGSDSLLDYEVVIFDGADLALAKGHINLYTLAKLAELNRKVYIAMDPLVATAGKPLSLILSSFNNNYTFAVLKSVTMPIDIKIDGFNVKVISRKEGELIRPKSLTQIIKYLPYRSEYALLPGISSKKSDYYQQLYLCLKASKCVPNIAVLRESMDAQFIETLTNWIDNLKKYSLKKYNREVIVL